MGLITARPNRASRTRKLGLLGATALVGVLLPMAAAQAQAAIRYTTSGTYTDDVAINDNTGQSMSTAAGTAANFQGTVSFGRGSVLFLNNAAPDYGTLIFAPTSISSVETSPGIFSGTIAIREGRVRFDGDAVRNYIALQGARVNVEGGVFDLAGSSFLIHNLGLSGGTVRNDAAGTLSTLSLNNGFLIGAITQGAGSLRLHKTGAGTLRIDNRNDYDGGTLHEYGTITLNHGLGLGTGLIEYASNGPSSAGMTFGTSLTLANDMLISGTAGVSLSANAGQTVVLQGNISGTGGHLVASNSGTIRLTGNNSYTGETWVNFGTVIADSVAGGEGALPDQGLVNIGRNGRLEIAAFERVDRITGQGALDINGAAELHIGDFEGNSRIEGAISGDGRIIKHGRGTLELNGNNTFTGGVLISDGRVAATRQEALGTGDVEFLRGPRARGVLDLTTGTELGQTFGNNLRFTGHGQIHVANRSADLTGLLSGSMLQLWKTGAGTLTLHANNVDAPEAVVTEGLLNITGTYGNNVRVENGGELRGTGSIDGEVNVAEGGRLEGRHGQTLTMGRLTLNEGATLQVTLGSTDDDAMFRVNGDVTLDGDLVIGPGDPAVLSSGTSPTRGVYRLINYAGTLIDNGMNILFSGEGNPGDLSLQTAIANQVNLVVAENGGGGGPGDPPSTQFWDGTSTTSNDGIEGGSGTWRAGTTNWTRANGEHNDAWGGGFAVFQGDAGTITIDNSAGAVTAEGMQFAVDGYTVDGGPVTLTGERGVIRVGDGTAESSRFRATITSNIQGDSSLVKEDFGTLVLTGNNSYTGNTLVLNGTLIGDTDSIRNNIGNNGHVVFDQEHDATFAGTISGSGTMAKRGAGALLLAGRSILDWTVEDGELTAQAGRFEGDVEIAANAKMAFRQTGSATYRGVVSGDGDFELDTDDNAYIRLTGNSSAFQGTTTVTGGRLLVDGGHLGGTLSMGSGTLLGGTGTVGTTIIGAGATVSPGNSIGTLTVDGDYTQRAGSTYLLEVNPEGESDLIDISGTANVEGGTVRVVNLGGTYGSNAVRYTILKAAGGLDGTYDDLDHEMPFLDLGLDYDGNNVYLDVSRNTVRFCDTADTRNQCRVANAAEDLGAGADVYDAVAGLGSREEAARAFDLLSGEVHASIKGGLIDESHIIRNAASSRVRRAFAGSATAVQDDASKGVWMEGVGSWTKRDATTESAATERSVGGLLAGIDGRIGDDWRVGTALGYTNGTLSSKARASSASYDSFSLAAYAGTRMGGFSLNFGAAHSWYNVETTRGVAFGTLSETLRGNYGARVAQAFGEVGYQFDTGAFAFEPFAGLAVVNLHTAAFAERGGAARLSTNASNHTIPYTTLGLRASADMPLASTMRVRAEGMLGWRHAFGNVTPEAAMRFAGGASAFTVTGAPMARDSLAVEAGLTMDFTPSATLGVSYVGHISSHSQDHGVRGQFSLKF